MSREAGVSFNRVEIPEGGSGQGPPSNFSLVSARMCSIVYRRCQESMFETLNDPVDVLTAFTGGKLEPLRFRWRGRVVRIRKITGRWSRRRD